LTLLPPEDDTNAFYGIVWRSYAGEGRGTSRLRVGVKRLIPVVLIIDAFLIVGLLTTWRNKEIHLMVGGHILVLFLGVLSALCFLYAWIWEKPRGPVHPSPEAERRITRRVVAAVVLVIVLCFGTVIGLEMHATDTDKQPFIVRENQ
jgi:hypothetical protein